MPEYLAPGVYIEERAGKRTIEGVSTSTAGFVGQTERGRAKGLPWLVTNFGEYQRAFGGVIPVNSETAGGEHGQLPLAVKQFFDNGGKRAFISRVFKARPDVAGVKVDYRELELKRGVFARLRANAGIGLTNIGVTTLRGFGYATATAKMFGGASPSTAVTAASAQASTREIVLGAPLDPTE